MNDYDAIVIGAGNGGLTASASLAKAGVKTLLLERHNIPGGCATSFVRGRFEFEVALHQLSGVGTNEFPGPLKGTFGELGVLDELQLVEMENLYRAVIPGDLDIVLKADRQQSIMELQKQFPAYSDGIAKFYDLVYEYCSQWVNVVFMKDPEASPAKYPVFFKYALKPMEEVMNDYFTDPFLQSAIGMYWSYLGIPPKMLAFGEFAVVLWAYTEFKPWHLKGGSQALSNALLNKFLEHGGIVRFNCGAKKINIEEGKIVNVITDEGDTVTTNRVVSNAGLYTTYVDLIDSDMLSKEAFRELNAKSVGTSAVSVFIGFDEEPQNLGIAQATNFLSTNPDANKAYEDTKTLRPPESMLFTCYDVDDPDFSPQGCCQGALISLAYGDPWFQIPTTQYYEKKYEFAQHMLKVLYQVFPQCENHIEEIEVGTPITHLRYLGHPGGAIYGFDQFAKDSDLFIDRSSPVEGLYHAGAWVGSGGFQPTLMSGTSAARAVIRSLQ